MYVGIFAKTFKRSSVEETFDAVAALGVTSVQFNMSCAGLSPMPDVIPAEIAARIADARGARGIEMAAISGTFNMAHPDAAARSEGLKRLDVLAGACATMGVPLITLCTGSRDPHDMWRRHPDNDGLDAWRDLVDSMRRAVLVAERHSLTLGVEPEVSNVIDSALKARRLLDEIGSPRLKIVFDAANIFHAGELPRMQDLLAEAMELLGRDVVLAHAKDLASDGAAGDRAAGTGVLDYDLYLSLLRGCHYDGPLILHGLGEPEAPDAIAFLRRALARAGA